MDLLCVVNAQGVWTDETVVRTAKDSAVISAAASAICTPASTAMATTNTKTATGARNAGKMVTAIAEPIPANTAYTDYIVRVWSHCIGNGYLTAKIGDRDGKIFADTYMFLTCAAVLRS